MPMYRNIDLARPKTWDIVLQVSICLAGRKRWKNIVSKVSKYRNIELSFSRVGSFPHLGQMICMIYSHKEDLFPMFI